VVGPEENPAVEVLLFRDKGYVHGERSGRPRDAT